ncbi:protein VASCULAR ASSOCIATED DEATH 1, chloroplastic isoform X2 [Typha latifolia]|uniref:protein VASCULAR ASSOCIATED DEATH 1, chloroplastic isoform X2 n=1 Tax=Typha latifolia TaxID=4733 RepID=UPI003C2C5BA4
MAVASPSREKTEMPAASPCRSSPSRAGRTDADAASESSSVHSGDTPDRRDVDALGQGLANRSEEYRLLFRLPPDEVLVQDFNCAFQENILLQGHMYLFIHHICFYSNIFGFETKKIIPFHEVTCVRKAKTAAIFPNAIEILTGGKRHFFGSFLSRDEAYRLIIDSWAQHSSDAKAFQDSLDSKSEGSSPDNGPVILEATTESRRYEDDLPSSYRIKDVDTSECKSMANDSFDINVSKTSLEVQQNGTEENVDHSYPVSPITWQCEDADAPNVPDYFTMVAEAKFPVCVEDVFNFFISDHGFNFLDDFHKRCGDKDFRCTPWRQHEQFGYVRNVSFLHPVKIYLGAKFGNCQEVQKFRVYRNSHIMIETSQQVSEVPYGDHFCVEGIWDIRQDFIEGNGCLLRVFSNVAFSKRTIFKGKIEQSTKDECREVYATWIKSAQELLKQKNIGDSEGVTDQNRAIGGSTVELGNSSKSLEETYATVNPASIPCDVTGTTSAVPPIEMPTQDNLRTSLASTFRELRSILLPYSKTSHFPLMLVIAFVAILILMQVIVILLLTRSPEVHLVTPDNYMSNPGNYQSDSIAWLEKRFRNLKEEMHLVETRMERMHYEFAWLKAHLESLEKLKAKS